MNLKQQNRFAALAALLSVGLAFTGCDDKTDYEPGDNGGNGNGTCTGDDCQQPSEPDCEKDPTAEGCESNNTPVTCEEDPTAEGCVDCEATPGEAVCRAAFVCAEYDKERARELISPKTKLPTIPELTVDGDETYRVLTFKAGGAFGTVTNARLYLDLDNNEFLDLNDEEALCNTDWDIAFDDIGFVYTRSGQNISGPEMGPRGPLGLMIATVNGVADEEAFKNLAQPAQADLDWKTDQYHKANGDAYEQFFLTVEYNIDAAIGAWFEYDFGIHTTDPKKVAYVIYNSPDGHHIYKIKFLSYDAHSTEIKLAVAEFTGNEPGGETGGECTGEECEEECTGTECEEEPADCDASPDAEACRAAFVCEAYDKAARAIIDPKVLRQDIPELSVQTEDTYRILRFKAGGNSGTPTKSRLYLDLDNNEFLDLNDEEALCSSAWEIAFDELGFAYTRSGQNIAGPEVGPRGPLGLWIATIAGVTNLSDFLNLAQPARSGIDWLFDQYLDEDGVAFVTSFLGITYNVAPAVGGWFSYDRNTHNTDPLDVAYVVYDSPAGHKMYKFKFLSYNSATKEIELVVGDFTGEEPSLAVP